MKDSRIFIDSNILLYLFDSDPIRSNFAKSLLAEKKFYISTQVISENVSVCIKKFRFSKEKAFQHGQILLERFHICSIDDYTIRKAFEVSQLINCSYWDSLIIASALENHCEKPLTEDMNHGQKVEGLEISNPFNINNQNI